MFHNLILCNRAATLTPGAGQALLAGTYPAALSAFESVLYDAGGASRYPLSVRATKDAAGADVVVKLQGAALPIDGACFASRTAGGAQGLCQIWGTTGDLYTVQLVQQVGGANLPYASTSTGTVGLDLAVQINLPTGANGEPAGTPASLAAYVTSALAANFSAVASGDTSGILGGTSDRRMAPRIHWADITSDVGGTVSVEHTIAATAGSSLDVVLIALPKNLVAVRALAKSAGVPGALDAVQVIAAVEGQ